MARRIRSMLLAGLLFALAVSGARAQSGGPYELTWTTVDAGGGNMTGGAYDLVSSIGQPEPGPTQYGGGYSLNGGVVDSGSSGTTPPGSQQVYLPLVMR